MSVSHHANKEIALNEEQKRLQRAYEKTHDAEIQVTNAHNEMKLTPDIINQLLLSYINGL